MDWQGDDHDPAEYMRTLRTDLFDDEVYVFTPKGEVKTLPAGGTPIDFAYAVHTDVGHKTVGAKVNGRIVPLHYKTEERRLRRDPDLEIRSRALHVTGCRLLASSRARNNIRQWFQRETKGETEAKGREALDQALKAQNLPYRKLQGSAVLAQVIRDLGFKKAEDFYLAVGSGKLGTGQVVNKVLQRLKTDQVAEEPAVTLKAPKARSTVTGETLGIVVQGVDDVLLRLAKCCTPVPGDEIRGYISLGRGITIHRADCPNVKALMRNPGTVHARGVGGKRPCELPCADRGRGLGPSAAARGCGSDIRRARREHRCLWWHRGRRHGEELVHGRARRCQRPARRCCRRSVS